MGLGAAFAGLDGPDPGEGFDAGPPQRQDRGARPPDARCGAWAGAPDRAVYAGEALGNWLWAIAWPTEAGCLIALAELSPARPARPRRSTCPSGRSRRGWRTSAQIARRHVANVIRSCTADGLEFGGVTARIERVVTEGVVDIDGVEHKVENNTWIMGDDDEVIVIDPARDAEKILEKVGEREVLAVICTHGLPDHVGAAIEVASQGRGRDRPPSQGQAAVAGDLVGDLARHRHGGRRHLRGRRRPARRHGDARRHARRGLALLRGARARSSPARPCRPTVPASSAASIPRLADQLTSIGGRLFTLPAQTRVLAAHGEEVTVGDLEPHFDDWLSGSLTRGTSPRPRPRAR